VLYFGAVGAVLAFIWLAQGGGAIEPAPGQHENGRGDKRAGGGGAAAAVPAMQSPYNYSYGEQPSQDTTSPDGASVNDNSSSDGTTSSTFSGVTGAGAGAGVAGSGIAPLRGGVGVGGYVQPSAPVAAAITQVTSGGSTYSGGYIPYNPGPYVPATSSAGGGGALRL
jgi:hypothetical protein